MSELTHPELPENHPWNTGGRPRNENGHEHWVKAGQDFWWCYDCGLKWENRGVECVGSLNLGQMAEHVIGLEGWEPKSGTPLPKAQAEDKPKPKGNISDDVAAEVARIKASPVFRAVDDHLHPEGE